MARPIVECIPNFSEGRRPAVMRAILDAIEGVASVRVLHHTADADHNRMVVTFVGPPAGVLEAAFAAVRTAARLIDLRQHVGVHPRVGAADVVPLIPLREMSMGECVLLARRLGQRIGDDLYLPVYLYEYAATRPERVNLAEVRRGGYEALPQRLQQPEHRPDFGPVTVGKAGACVVGARDPLLAYNVFLTTDDVSIAQAIARQIRQSSGGLPGVKALGLRVQGQAQVSMNLTRLDETGLHEVMSAIRAAARSHGVRVDRAELIGLMPLQVLTDMARHALQLPDFDVERVLEAQLTRLMNP